VRLNIRLQEHRRYTNQLINFEKKYLCFAAHGGFENLRVVTEYDGLTTEDASEYEEALI
jgi:hypothetical protein